MVKNRGGSCFCHRNSPLCRRRCEHCQQPSVVPTKAFVFPVSHFVYSFVCHSSHSRDVHEQTTFWVQATVDIMVRFWDRLQVKPCTIEHTFLGVFILVRKLYADDNPVTMSENKSNIMEDCVMCRFDWLETLERTVFLMLGGHVQFPERRLSWTRWDFVEGE